MARESALRKEPVAMDIYAELSTPGVPHKLLARMAGSWSMKGRCRMEPGGDWIDHTGISEQRMILGGRFLQQDFNGEMMGIPFTGIGFTGYDNNKGKFVSTWLDSFGTGIYHFEGTGSSDGKTINQTCSYDDPVRGPLTLRNVTRIVDANTFEFRMYTTDSGGQEEEMAVLLYTRTA